MNIKYFFGAIASIPLLPLLYIQAKRVRSNVPKLPAATGTEGFVVGDSEHKIRLLVIGESTMAGVGVAVQEEGFAGTLAREIALKLNANVHWKVYAKSGYTVRQITEHIVPTIKEKEVDLIVIGIGANDAFTMNTPGGWRLHIRGLLKEIRSKFDTVPIVFLNMPPIKAFPAFTPLMKFTIGNLVGIFGAELSKLIVEENEVYFSSEIITLNGWIQKMNLQAVPTDFFSDGVHPSKLTYQIWAKDFCRFLLVNKIIMPGL